ncbi:MAG: hypothetical protein ABR946_08445 [Solirubrobacteraceae bacterium]|jgi:BMFP domain-containing protein YqiC
MAGDPTPPLFPDSAAARVAEILAGAARDARAIVEAAWRDASSPPVPAEPGAAPNLVPPSAAFDGSLASLSEELTALTARVARLESAINARLEGLRQVLAADGASATTAGADRPVAPGPNSGAAVPTRAERVRAVDLALQGYSRVQIASELRSSMNDDAVEQLLDEVLERT